MALGAEEKNKQSVISVLFHPTEDRRRNSSPPRTLHGCCQVTEGLYKLSVCPSWHTEPKLSGLEKKQVEGKAERAVRGEVRCATSGHLNAKTVRVMPHKMTAPNLPGSLLSETSFFGGIAGFSFLHFSQWCQGNGDGGRCCLACTKSESSGCCLQVS